MRRAEAEPMTDVAIENCYHWNDDSCGFSYINTDHLGVSRIKTHKYMELAPFMSKLRRCEAIAPDSPFLVHFRIATSGELSTHNQHPFDVDRGQVMGHNGVLACANRDPMGKDNDTRMYIKDTIRKLPSDWLDSEVLVELVEDQIGTNKLVFLDETGRYDILNQELGTWVEGIWYSNDSYKRKPYRYKPYKPAHKPAKRIVGSQQVPYKWTFNSKVTCDKCRGLFNIFRCTAYDVYSTVDIYCKECEKEVLDDCVVYPSEKCMYGIYLDFKNGLPTRYEEDFENLADGQEMGWNEHTGANC